jgi:cytochrome P450
MGKDGTTVPSAPLADSASVMAGVIGPTIAKGVLIRRPKIVALAERLDLDGAAVRRMQKLRRRYGQGPLRVRMPGPPRVLILSDQDLRTVLDGTPEPFAAASREKRAALAHFEPKVALASHGAKRRDRRRFNEEALETAKRMHSMANTFADVVDAEAEMLLREADKAGELDWELFFESWYRVVRRVILGNGARDDDELTDMLAQLRARGNWAFFQMKARRLRERFHRRLTMHIERGEPGSLAERINSLPKSPITEPSHQVAQWLFAFDPGGMATFRALAMLAIHEEEYERARQEATAADRPAHLPILRGSLLEALRLWPTTPAILRETTQETEWENGRLPAKTGITIYAPYFHRDETRIEFAHRFVPHIWVEGDPAERFPLVPFSRGPGACPASNFVPMVASHMLAALLSRRRLRLVSHQLSPNRDLPGLLDNYRLRFAFA